MLDSLITAYPSFCGLWVLVNSKTLEVYPGSFRSLEDVIEYAQVKGILLVPGPSSGTLESLGIDPKDFYV